MKKYLKWDYKEIFISVIGLFLYCLSIKIFITPNNLYNGGIMGLSQLLRTFIVNKFNLTVNFDLSSIIYYIINIPLFFLAYKKLGRPFFYRTFFCVTISAVFLFFIPSFNKPITDDLLTNILIGGCLCGFGTGLAITSGASTGGTDIIGMILTNKYRSFSVGTFNLGFNIVIYSISGIIGGIETMIYSILYSILDSVTLDRMHARNICSTVFIFSKDNPKKIIEYIKTKLGRDATYWKAIGGYDDTTTYMTYTVLSKYEKHQLELAMQDINKQAFIVSNDRVSVIGNFKKKL